MKKFVSISLSLILGLSACSNSVFAGGKDTGFTEKAIPVVRDRLDSSETATLRYYEDLPNVPYMSVTDFYNEFELAGTDLTEGISFDCSNGQYTLTTFNGDKAVQNCHRLR